MQQLPADTLLKILQQGDCSSVLTLCRTSSDVRRLCEENIKFVVETLHRHDPFGTWFAGVASYAQFGKVCRGVQRCVAVYHDVLVPLMHRTATLHGGRERPLVCAIEFELHTTATLPDWWSSVDMAPLVRLQQQWKNVRVTIEIDSMSPSPFSVIVTTSREDGTRLTLNRRLQDAVFGTTARVPPLILGRVDETEIAMYDVLNHITDVRGLRKHFALTKTDIRNREGVVHARCGPRGAVHVVDEADTDTEY